MLALFRVLLCFSLRSCLNCAGEIDTAHAAARAYDRAAIKFRGIDAYINFNVSDYDEDIKQRETREIEGDGIFLG
ncbi:hypothetical protein HN51_005318 [Arachis hypogaea]